MGRTDSESQFTSQLEVVDETLAAAQNPSSVGTSAVNGRLERAAECLRLLELDRRRTLTQDLILAISVNENATSVPTPAAKDQPHIGRFRILRRLGKGGFGVVFLAEDPVLDRKVAIKIPRGETLMTPDLQNRFVQESRFAARLTHPHLVPIYEAGQAGTVAYQVTEYCSGGSLAEWLKQIHGTSVPLPVAVELLIGIADGIHHAHEHGILHRDLKPANILLRPINESTRIVSPLVSDSNGSNRKTNASGSHEFVSSSETSPEELCELYRPMVTDFGLARLLEDEESFDKQVKTIPLVYQHPSGVAQDRNVATTHYTAVAGTMSYMAPEQMEGRAADLCPATDVHGLGLILFEVLTGTSMYQASQQVTQDDDSHQSKYSRIPVSLRTLRNDIPHDMEAICRKCVEPEIDDRYSSAKELADDLRAFSRGEPVLARPWPWHEQLVKWALRRPTIAAMLTFCAVLAVSLIGFGAWHLHKLTDLNEQLFTTSNERQKQTEAAILNSRRADEQTQIAESNSLRAQQESHRAAELAWISRQREYSAEMMQAANFFQRGEIAQMNESLQRFQVDWGDDPRGFEWHYLWNQGRTLRPLSGHSGDVKAVEFTADQSRCYSIGGDNTIRLWNMQTGLQEREWKFDTDSSLYSSKVAFSQNAMRAVFVRSIERRGIDEAIVWDTQSNRILMRREYRLGTTDAVAIEPNGRQVVICGSHNRDGFQPFTELWLPETNTVFTDHAAFHEILESDPQRHVHSVAAMAFTPDGSELAMAMRIAGPGVWEHLLIGSCIASLAERTRVESDNSQRPLFEKLQVLGSPREGIPKIVRFSTDGKFLAMTTQLASNSVELWDWKSGTLVKVSTPTLKAADSIAFDSSGTRLGISIVRPGLTANGQLAHDGEKAVTESESEFLLWDFQADTTEVLPYPETRDVMYLKPLPQELGNGWLVGEGGGAVNLWRPNSEPRHRSLPGHHPHEAWGVAFSSDGSTVFSVGDDHRLRSWHTTTGIEKAAAQPRNQLVSCVAVSPDKKLIAAGGYDDNVVIHNSATLEVIATLTGHTHDIRAIAFSHDGRKLATAGRDESIRIWSIPEFTRNGTLEGHQNTIRSLHWLSNGHLISSDSDGRIVFWDSDGKIIRERHESEGVHCVAFAPRGLRMPRPIEMPGSSAESWNPDVDSDNALSVNSLTTVIKSEELIAIGLNHGTVRLWHLPTDSIWSAIHFPGVDVRSLAFSPNGQTLAVAGSDSAVRLINVPTGREVMTLGDVGSPINQLAFSSNGHILAAALHAGEIRTWTTAP